MSSKWTGAQSECGILRKSEYKEKKEDLFVFGYSCKLFRDDDKALHIDQGKHLIPWMGDETLKIDRYDARGALHDLSTLEAPSGGYDWRVELTKDQLDVEQLCDDERYRALHTDEDEEEMYKEEELKRLHAAGYGQVGFNYDAPAEPSPQPPPTEVDEPFVPLPAFKALLPVDTVFPETQKQNAIIEKTANFIASQGAQMEILIKAKQRDNVQFQFLAKESNLHPYYTALIALVKAGKWPEKKVEVVEEKPPENEEYLHPSLASTVIESAPAIPSIHYKPSADCDYTMLISKMRGDGDHDGGDAGDVPPPGTEPPRPTAQIYRAPVMYTRGVDGNQVQPAGTQNYTQQYAAYYHQYMAQEQEKQKKQPPGPLKSTGLSLMKNYNTDSDSDASDFDDSSSTDSKEPTMAIPPDEIKVVIDKMAAYVARNGDEFADIVRAKNDPRFTFLATDNIYYAYYKKLMQQKRSGDVNGRDKKRKSAAPVSFSIKKLKEPDPILPKPALPYESSSDEDSEKQTDKSTEKQEDLKDKPKPVPTFHFNNIPPVVVYKIDGQLNNDLSIVKAIEPVKQAIKTSTKPIPAVAEVKKDTTKPPPTIIEENVSAVHEKSPKQDIEKDQEITRDKKERSVEKERGSPHRRDRESPQKWDRDSPRKRDMESPQKKDRESPHKRDKESPLKRDRESPFKRDGDSPHKRDRDSPHKRDRDSPHKRDRDSPNKRREDRDSPHKRTREDRDSPHKRTREERDSPHKRAREERDSSHKRDRDDRDSPHKRDRDSPHKRDRVDRDSPYKRHRSPHKRDKKKHRDRKKEYMSKSASRAAKRSERRSAERAKKKERDAERDRERESKRSKYREEMENEVISLEDNSDDLIDLTGDQSDSKVEETEAERAKQQERRRRAAEFLKKVGVDPAAAQLPTSSLASAMVDTLESLRKKKAEEEEKKRRREKRRHRERRDYDDESERSHRKSKRRKYKSSDDNNESDYDNSKKKKRKKDRKHNSKNKRKKRRENEIEEEDPPPVVNIDLTNTLKELRTSSPTKDLGLHDVQETQIIYKRRNSSDEELIRIKRKTDRQYSEGEWSSDSEGDSKSSASKGD